jgi:mannose/cellobiose epimerase-like protein (N-acyl-D-glucosamine 2-epimerase family)
VPSRRGWELRRSFLRGGNAVNRSWMKQEGLFCGAYALRAKLNPHRQAGLWPQLRKMALVAALHHYAATTCAQEAQMAPSAFLSLPKL